MAENTQGATPKAAPEESSYALADLIAGARGFVVKDRTAGKRAARREEMIAALTGVKAKTLTKSEAQARLDEFMSREAS